MPFSCHWYCLSFWCREGSITEQIQPNHVYTWRAALACSVIEITHLDNLTSKCRNVFTAVNQALILVRVFPDVAWVHPLTDCALWGCDLLEQAVMVESPRCSFLLGCYSRANDSTVAKLHYIGYANRLNVLWYVTLVWSRSKAGAACSSLACASDLGQLLSFLYRQSQRCC